MNDNFDVSDISGETGRRLAKEPRLTVVLGGRSDDAPWEGGINGQSAASLLRCPKALQSSYAKTSR